MLRIKIKSNQDSTERNCGEREGEKIQDDLRIIQNLSTFWMEMRSHTSLVNPSVLKKLFPIFVIFFPR